MLRRLAAVRVRPAVQATAVRHFIEDTTKGNAAMKHLDLYARRDPQLAPYLLREVDIEWKRKCRKVNFVFWMAIATCLILLDQRLSAEAMHLLRRYIELLRIEQDAKDEDSDLRRAKLVGLMRLLRECYARGGKWSKSDSRAAEDILRAADVPEDQRRPAVDYKLTSAMSAAYSIAQSIKV